MARSKAGHKRLYADDDGDIEGSALRQHSAAWDPPPPALRPAGSITDMSIGSRHWLIVLVLSAAVAIICSVDRAAMSVTILPMSKQFGWRDSVMGAVSSSFNWGYMFTNLFGGYLAGRFGPERTLAGGVVVWTSFTMLTPPAALSGHLPLLLLVRALMGLGEGVAFPCMQYLVKQRMPPDKRTRALGLIYSGHQLGSVLSLMLSPGLIESRMGWPAVFYVYGALGFVWLALWWPLVVTPARAGTRKLLAADGKLGRQLAAGNQQLTATDRQFNATGKKELAADGKVAEADGKLAFGLEGRPMLLGMPWRRVAGNRVVWALLVAHCNMGVSYNMAHNWLPVYFAKEFHVSVRESSSLSILPWLMMALTTNIVGWVADALINKHVLSTTKTRKLMQLIGTLGPAACLWHLSTATSDPQLPSSAVAATQHAMWLLTGMMGTLGTQAAGFASTHQDIAPAHIAASLFGATNAACSLVGSLSVYATGLVLERTNSWGAVFRGVAGCNLACALLFVALASSTPQFD